MQTKLTSSTRCALTLVSMMTKLFDCVRMLQNSVANVPNLANVLNLHCQTKSAAGLSIKITLREHVALLA